MPSLKNFLTVSTKDQMRFLDAVVMRFVDRMDESLNGRLKEFSQVLGETTRAQEEAFSAVRMSMLESEAAVRDLRGVQKISQDMIDAMTGYLNDLRTTHKQADDAYARHVLVRGADGAGLPPADGLSEDRQRHAGRDLPLAGDHDPARSTSSPGSSPPKTPPRPRPCSRPLRA